MFSRLVLFIPLSYCVVSLVNKVQGPLANKSFTDILGGVVVAYVLLSSVWLLWSQFLYPTFFSPLRAVPRAKTPWQPYVWKWLYAVPDPPQLLTWSNTIPNTGFIRFSGAGSTEHLLVTDERLAMQILVTQTYTAFSRPPSFRQRLATLIGEGLVWAEGDTHKIQKRKLHAAFGQHAVQNLYPAFWSKANEMVSHLADLLSPTSAGESTGKQSLIRDVDLLDWISRQALDIIGVAAWGKDFETLANPASNFHTVYSRQFIPVPGKHVFLSLSPVLPRLLTMLLFHKHVRVVRDAALVAGKASRTALGIEKTKAATDGKYSGSILGVAMKSGAFSDKELVSQLRTLLAAGHETTSGTAVFMFYMLSRYPAIQERLRKEISGNVRSSSAPGSEGSEFFERLPYTQAVLNEVLRLWPVIGVLPREATQCTVVGDQTIPAGTFVAISPYVLNHSQKTWGPDADEFDPDRWLLPESSTVDKNLVAKLQTFSTGPKSCIGQTFARGELLTLMTAMIGKFEIGLEKPDEEVELFWGIALKPAYPLKFWLKPIDS